MIKNIISDIGNVLFEFDTSGFIDKNIEAEDKEKFFDSVFASDNWRLLDKGDLSFEDGRNYFLSVFPKYKDILNKLFDSSLILCLNMHHNNINILKEYKEKYDVQIYAYCIMSNHFHLLIKADLEELASFMAKILAIYAIYYNKIHQRIGYVFEGRYKSQCIEDTNYFWNCFRYIHRNPVKAGIVKNEMQYKYSSFNEYYGTSKIISTKPIETIYGNMEACKRAMEQIGQLRSKDFETEDDVDYEELVREYIKRQVEVDAIIKMLDEKYKISSRKIASLVGTTRYYVRKVIEK